MKIQELKSKIKTEDFETVCLLIYDAVADNKITSEQFVELIGDVSAEFDVDDFNDDFNEDENLTNFEDYDDDDFSDDY